MRSDNFLINAFIALSLLMTTGFISVAQTPVETHGSLRVEGNQIVGEHGEPVQLMGMSHYWSLADLSESSAALKPVASTSGGWDPETDLSPSGKLLRSKIIEINSKKPYYK